MNRKLPFGYRMEQGEIRPHPQEAECVKAIYMGYLSGASFQALSEQMREAGTPYLAGKAWNKNMVARILEDARYLGEGKYPPLIPPEVFQRAQQRRQAVCPPRLRTAAEKALRRLCRRTPPKTVQRALLDLLNGLIQDPRQIRREAAEPDGVALAQRRREVEEALCTPPIDEAKARDLALRYAADALQNIGSEEYETKRLRQIYEKHPPMAELDADLLEKTIRRIRHQRGAIEILLKNGQWVKGGPAA